MAKIEEKDEAGKAIVSIIEFRTSRIRRKKNLRDDSQNNRKKK